MPVLGKIPDPPPPFFCKPLKITYIENKLFDHPLFPFSALKNKSYIRNYEATAPPL